MADQDSAPAPITQAAPAPGETPAPSVDTTSAAPAPDPAVEAQKAADAAKAAAPVIPDKYEFKGEDGNPLLPDEVVNEWAPVFKDLKLDQAGAEKLVQHQLKQQAVMGKQLDDALTNDRTVWKQLAQSDPTFGGVNFEANVKLTNEAVAKYGDAEFSSLLKDSGLGDHPAVLRFLASVGKTIKQNDALPGEIANAQRGAPQRTAADLYRGTPKTN